MVFRFFIEQYLLALINSLPQLNLYGPMIVIYPSYFTMYLSGHKAGLTSSQSITGRSSIEKNDTSIPVVNP